MGSILLLPADEQEFIDAFERYDCDPLQTSASAIQRRHDERMLAEIKERDPDLVLYHAFTLVDSDDPDTSERMSRSMRSEKKRMLAKAQTENGLVVCVVCGAADPEDWPFWEVAHRVPKKEGIGDHFIILVLACGIPCNRIGMLGGRSITEAQDYLKGKGYQLPDEEAAVRSLARVHEMHTEIRIEDAMRRWAIALYMNSDPVRDTIEKEVKARHQERESRAHLKRMAAAAQKEQARAEEEAARKLEERRARRRERRAERKDDGARG